MQRDNINTENPLPDNLLNSTLKHQTLFLPSSSAEERIQFPNLYVGELPDHVKVQLAELQIDIS